MNKRLLITALVALFLVVGTLIAIRFAKGYRFNLKEKKVNGTGLLVTNSFPEGASVFINDKLTTATDDTLNLPPGEYQIKIVKEGFITWEKKLTLEAELVTQTNTHLFPAVPNLKGLTSSGALNITPAPDGQKIAFTVASASARLKNGLWVLDLTNSPLSLSREPRQIVASTAIFDFTNAQLVWSPNSEQILAKTAEDTVLVNAGRFNEASDLTDVTARLTLILDDWEEQFALKKKRQWRKLPEEVQQVASESAKYVYFSPDEEKILYLATANTTLPEELIPPLPASNTQLEARNIETDKLYVYDLKEDRNFYIMDHQEELEPTEEQTETIKLEQRLIDIQNKYSPINLLPLQWFPTSKHLIFTNSNKIAVLEYDNTNHATVYAGPFEESFAYPWPDGSKLLILTSLNPDSQLPPNLYAIDLK